MILNSSDVARRVALILCRSLADKKMKHISDYAANAVAFATRLPCRIDTLENPLLESAHRLLFAVLESLPKQNFSVAFPANT